MDAEIWKEKARQQAVVKKFIANHPEYNPTNETNNKMLVDFIEVSLKPFITDTIEWAYQHLKGRFFKPSAGQTFQYAKKPFQMVSYNSFPMAKSTNTITVDPEPKHEYNVDIAPTSTGRRIKKDD
jgi:hypothetical protein